MSKPNVMTYAKEIRKEGEKWEDAVARAAKILSGQLPKEGKTFTKGEFPEADNIPSHKAKTTERTKHTGSMRNAGETGEAFMKRKRSM
ncbi:hypothetical protein [Brumimicrobium aurantiacum]|uniref:Uncharacterized protein n=1 Tax=Brumimicrobium aurantiacum TaxID=1737063 RepID=A0A3E1EZ82_9FLAO|nr:hypothetical protein [Brumimicrobium aurantiacum]RFC54864.1 hypothetical protein DXU93_03320 [Brumimicrobium aurantiacum]